MLGMSVSEPKRQGRKRALFRLVLGQLQIIGATAGFYLLMTTGASQKTVIVVGTTLIISITSRIIFRSKCRPCLRDNGKGNTRTE